MEVLLIWVVLGFVVVAVAAAIRHLRHMHQERLAAIAAAEHRRKKWVRDIEQFRFPTRALLHSESRRGPDSVRKCGPTRLPLGQHGK